MKKILRLLCGVLLLVSLLTSAGCHFLAYDLLLFHHYHHYYP